MPIRLTRILRTALAAGAAVLFLVALAVPRARCADSPVVINEIFVDGSSNYQDWVELYNRSDGPVSLKGYALTDDLEERSWTVKDDFILAPGGFKVFYCDGQGLYDHVGFRLDSISGEVGLFSPRGALVDSMTYDGLPRFFSLGRWPDGDGDFAIHASPTKGSANSESRTYMRDSLGAPVSFSRPSGRCTAPFDLVLSAPDGLGVRFTTDGSLPGPDSPEYGAPVRIDETTVVRASAVTPEGRMFTPATRSYLFGEHTLLPVVSVVTAPDNLWDPEVGIYAEGTSGKDGVGNSQNWRHNWRRPVHLDYLSPEGDWQADGRMRIFGGASRGRPQKSLAVYTTSRDEPYGIRHSLFPGDPRDRYAGLLLRNGGDAWLRTQFRDAFQHVLVQGRVACDTMPYRPVIVYLNGRYWGLYGLRELMIRKNLLARHGLAVQPIDMMDGGGEVGSDKGPFADMPPVPKHGDYRPAMAALDIDAYLDYVAVETYSGNPDWPDGNIKAWRPRSGALKWQWILFDLDRGFNGKRGLPADRDPFAILYDRRGGNGLMFSELAENRMFVRDFCARLAVHMLTTFAPKRALGILDRMAGDVRPEMERHIDRWRWDWKIDRLFMTPKDWEANLDQLREYVRKRPQAMLDILDKRFGVGGPVDVSVRVARQGRGRILAEGVVLDDGRLEGPVPGGLDIVLTAEPAPGYVFKGWAGRPGVGPQIRVKPGIPFEDTAIFEPNDDKREES
ncbi:CotH protein [Pseudodesulfovibrio hydrargyri]|uniref:CotH protein n=1 Tax=Pseudodesulfovibrio hydrargyri TaxID=2125990 RepID=A0A1J5MUV8_9BACT|nr:CotH kinase family protein [Pseudodesulfovibrio hydrargyri]OIQ50390.1 CotH protein [Pseudodesulfovibrio hydrargyri]